jgi:hypothetical protein
VVGSFILSLFLVPTTLLQLWLVIASFLACFDIGKAKDEFGNKIELDDSFNEFGIVMYVQISIKNTDLGLSYTIL